MGYNSFVRMRFYIIGYSGAGKSTLVHLINQLEVQDLGSTSQSELRKLKTKIGMIF